jgi:hypothetical protein
MGPLDKQFLLHSVINDLHAQTYILFDIVCVIRFIYFVISMRETDLRTRNSKVLN